MRKVTQIIRFSLSYLILIFRWALRVLLYNRPEVCDYKPYIFNKNYSRVQTELHRPSYRFMWVPPGKLLLVIFGSAFLDEAGLVWPNKNAI